MNKLASQSRTDLCDTDILEIVAELPVTKLMGQHCYNLLNRAALLHM